MKNVVVIGGGTGTSTLLKGLIKFPVNSTVVVSSADDGGSAGILRKELSILPMGDLRQCLVGLSEAEPELRNLFNYRFTKGFLKGHAAGNIILAALEKITGNIDQTIRIASKILNVRGQILPVTIKPTILSVVLQDGKKLVGEHNIDIPQKHAPIKSISLSSAGAINPVVKVALEKADLIVLGPGDLYTSTLPNLLVKGVKEAIDKSKAKKVLVANIMTQSGQTDGFKIGDFVNVINQFLGQKKLDVVIVNTKKPDSKSLAIYKKQGALPILPEVSYLKDINVIKANLLADGIYKKSKADVLSRSLLRHNSNKLAKIIYGLSK